MTLGVPRYPEFKDLHHWEDQSLFYVPELEMTYGEICSAMKKCWIGYKWARREGDVPEEEHYADIIQGIIEGLGYRPMTFHIAEYYDNYPETTEYEPQAEEGEAQEADEIEEEVERRRKMAVQYGKSFKKFDWHTVAQQYIRYISPEEEDDGYLMEAEGEDVENEEISF